MNIRVSKIGAFLDLTEEDPAESAEVKESVKDRNVTDCPASRVVACLQQTCFAFLERNKGLCL